MKNSYLLLLSVVFLTACASTGQPYTPIKANANEAKVVVYRTSTPFRTITVTIDGTKCDMPPNSYFVKRVKPNAPIEVTADMWDAMHPTRQVITVSSGSAKHLRLTNRTSAIALLGLGGVIGNAVSTDGIFAFSDGNPTDASKTGEVCG